MNFKDKKKICRFYNDVQAYVSFAINNADKPELIEKLGNSLLNEYKEYKQ
jgi:hypothetical protein